jgi:diguanylate cyclase (GGDEF)-like protein
MKLLMRDEAKGKEHTIFVTIFVALMAMLVIMVMLMASAIAASGVTLQLDENAVDILDKQVENRARYIELQLQQAQDLMELSSFINGTARQMLDEGTISLDTLDSTGGESLPLLQAAAPRLLESLRAKQVSGVFLILNTRDFTGRTSSDRLPCVYLRDLDPEAPSADNSDVMFERAPAELVQAFGITTDKAWTPAQQYLDGEEDVFYVRPFQAAYESGERTRATDYGRWTTLPYTLPGDDREAIAYAQPLILDDGTVYGILGIEMLESYMDTKLPWDELQNDHHGSYLLASTTSDLQGEVLQIYVTANTGEQTTALRKEGWELTLHRAKGYWYYRSGGADQVASIRQISLYDRNAPFSGERWLLIGVVGKNDLFRFSRSVMNLVSFAILLTLGVGLGCAFFVSIRLAQPLAQLSKELADAQEWHQTIPEFSRTGIRELDRLADAIVTLSTDNYKAAVAERNRIERERDYDVLTGLYSRQAFFRVCGELFEKPRMMRCAALMMTDLDNLKTINDTYGHDWGDIYLRQTAHSLQQGVPSGTVVARLSGDEFLLLFYGYETKEAVRKDIRKMEEGFARSSATLPDGKKLCIRMSGGIAWYPDDAADLETLKRYADFAMYEVKHSTKGEVREFNMEHYRDGIYAMKQRSDFEVLVRERQVDYYFQPIFSARDGHVAAYEALMRPRLPALSSPQRVMELASEMGRLYDIEKLTLFRACECYEALEAAGKVESDARVFVNSIASVSLNDEDWAHFRAAHKAILPKLVVEITEEEEMNEQALEQKRNAPGAPAIFALDDYGSGYSNGNSLLTIAPHYVKVDIAIIRGIDADPDKQQFLKALIEYARPRGVQVLAEGVETMDDLRRVLEMGVDLLQGYCLARPAAEPLAICEKAARVIEETARQRDV